MARTFKLGICMQVSQAVAQRKSIRAFLDKPVSDEVLRQLLEKASRAPSGGNLQPWRVFVINGDTMPTFLEFLAGRQEREAAEYAIYPKDLTSPIPRLAFQSWRRHVCLIRYRPRQQTSAPSLIWHGTFPFLMRLRFFLFCRPTNGTASMVRFRYVLADLYAFSRRIRAVHLRPRSVGKPTRFSGRIRRR